MCEWVLTPFLLHVSDLAMLLDAIPPCLAVTPCMVSILERCHRNSVAATLAEVCVDVGVCGCGGECGRGCGRGR